MKACPILIVTMVAAAVPAVAQVGPSAVSAVARTAATTRIDQPATITTSQDLAFAVPAPVAAALAVPTVRAPRLVATNSAATVTPTNSAAAAQGTPPATTPAANSLVRNATASMVAPVPAAAQATFTVSGDSGQAISVIVPATVEMASSGGVETALLTTSNNLADGPQFLGGTFASGGTLSFAVGGQVMLASSTTMSTGTYNGLLAVVAQYN